METLSDISLVSRVALLNDRRAFDCLVRKYQSHVRRFFLNHTLGDTQLSEDLAQDTFIKAYTGIKAFRGTAAFSTWLFRIAYNVLCDHIRTHHPTGDIDTGMAASRTAATAGTMTDSTLRMDIYGALARLNPAERSCITLQLIEGMQIERIAEVTELPPNTVKSHLARGKRKLADYLKSNGYDRR